MANIFVLGNRMNNGE